MKRTFLSVRMANRNGFIIALYLGITLNLIASTTIPPFYNTQFVSYGQRQTGDHLLKALRKVIDWPAPHETTQIIRYPENGSGAMITRVELNAETDSAAATSCKLTAGGPGQNFVEITAKLSGVTHSVLTLKVYGNSGPLVMPPLKLIFVYISYIGYMSSK